MDLLHSSHLAWTQYRTFHAALAELERRSDRELSELGVARGDVPRIAYEAAEQHVAALAATRPALTEGFVPWPKPAIARG